MSQLTTDLASIAADPLMGPAVVMGSVTVRCPIKWEEVPKEDSSGGIVMVKERTIYPPTASVVASAIAIGSTITVDAVSYVVRELPGTESGALTRMVIAKV